MMTDIKKLVFAKGKQVDSCPYCGCATYHVTMLVSGKSVYHRDLTGEPSDNQGMHDPLSYRELKTAYCSDCLKKIGTVRDAQ